MFCLKGNHSQCLGFCIIGTFSKSYVACTASTFSPYARGSQIITEVLLEGMAVPGWHYQAVVGNQGLPAHSA